jgi:hypothetical protein
VPISEEYWLSEYEMQFGTQVSVLQWYMVYEECHLLGCDAMWLL